MLSQEGNTNFLHSVTSFYLENLSHDLLDAFIPQRALPMRQEALASFAAHFSIPNVALSRESIQAMEQFFCQLDQYVRAIPQGCFVRLGSRSPKDTVGFTSLKAKTGLEALRMCMQSRRIHADVRWNCIYNYAPTFFVRPWLEMERWREVRCFVRDRKLWGMSQYYCLEGTEFSQIAHHAYTIAETVTDFIKEKVIPATDHDAFACDVYYVEGNIKIIDYNPFVAKTGMCLFDSAFSNPRNLEFRFYYNGKAAALPIQEN